MARAFTRYYGSLAILSLSLSSLRNLASPRGFEPRLHPWKGCVLTLRRWGQKWSRVSDSNRRRDYSRRFTKAVLLPLSHYGIKNKDNYDLTSINVKKKVVVPAGFEPATNDLKGRCSTIELKHRWWAEVSTQIKKSQELSCALWLRGANRMSEEAYNTWNNPQVLCQEFFSRNVPSMMLNAPRPRISPANPKMM